MIPHRDEILRPAISTDATAVPRYNLVRPDGTIIEKNAALKLANPVAREGTPISKAVLDEMLAASGVTAGTATAYTLAQEEYTLFDGAPVRFRLHTASGDGATLNINGTGAKPLRVAEGDAMPRGLPVGTWLTAYYSAAEGAYVLADGEAIQALYGERHTVDDAVTYIKDVPADVLTHAEVAEVGGMTRKCTNLLPLKDYSRTVNNVAVSISKGVVTVSGTADNNGGRTSPICDTFILKAGTYTFSFTNEISALYIYLNKSIGNTALATASKNGTSITLEEDTAVYLGLNVEAGATYNESFSVMLNEGTEPFPYEPYFEGLRSAPVTEMESVGGNIFGGSALADRIVEIYKGTKNEADKTVSFGASNVDSTKPLYAQFKPNTQYTFMVSVSNSDIARTNLMVKYTDGKDKILELKQTGIKTYIVYVSDAGKTIESFIGSNNGGITNLDYEKCGIFEGALTEADFKQYVRDTLPIPEAVRALDGYGESNPDDATEYNAIKWLSNGERIYSHKGNIVDGAWVPLVKEEITDISSILPADNLLPVEAGGTITAVNEYGYAVPTKITYQRDVLANRASIFALEKLRLAMELLAKADLSNVSGTFGGVVKANAAAVANLGTAQVRNVTISATDLTAGSSALATGDSYHVYS